ncbi:MAG TPA: hypothetical protein VF316_21440 [Polyangiaceae bacterium]
MPTAPSSASIHVTVIAESPETIDGLHAYLDGAGVESHAVQALRDAKRVPLKSTAVVIFPDEFVIDDVVASITSLRSARPRLLILLVTGAPQRFRPALEPDGKSLPPVVLPKPAFGWTILDAIRAHASASR